LPAFFEGEGRGGHDPLDPTPLDLRVMDLLSLTLEGFVGVATEKPNKKWSSVGYSNSSGAVPC